MGFVEAIRTVIAKQCDYSGRARRREFWFFFLAWFIAFCVILAAAMIAFDRAYFPYYFAAVLLIALFVISAVVVRRLHDVDRSGWWALVYFVPGVGPLILLIMLGTKGVSGPNRYGPDPIATRGDSE